MSTDTAPTSEIPKLYDPQAAQAQWSAFWEQGGFFNAEPGTGKKPHTIMIPLPNVTGALHMGHALNGTCQDLVTRWKRMQGYEALWMPGTDHAGIATQAVVERRMFEEEGLTRHTLAPTPEESRKALVDRIWKWKDTYEARIISQLKLLGFSCDWRRTRFTLDEVCSKAVRRTFFKMFQDGYIFRGKRLVNWDCFLQTAVADDEVYDEEIDGHFWTFNYPVVDEAGKPTGESIRFSTTRPETMLGDTAVCVNPTDERYKHLWGKKVQIPLNGRLIPVITDGQLADKNLGTGCVKVTPAHDPNDYACWNRNKDKKDELGNPLMGEPINILNPDGTINEKGRPASGGRESSVPAVGSSTPPTYVAGSLDFTGLDRLVAREHVIEEMKRLGHFEGVEDRKIPMKHSDRSKTPIEPYLSEQWFVKMDDWSDGRPGLAQSALDAVNDGRVKFFPQRYTKTYLDWLGEKRDWCISRQLWWGHRIPVWTTVCFPVEYEVPESEVYAELERATADADARAHSRFKDAWHRFMSAQGIHESEYEIRFDGMKAMICPGTSAAEMAINFVENPSPKESNGFLESAKQQWGTSYQTVLAAHNALSQVMSAPLFAQDPDVLDTWFSSALWPHATLGWPDTEHNPPLEERGERREESGEPAKTVEESSLALASRPSSLVSHGNAVLSTFYPGSVLITSRDIITLWVARMVLTGLYNMGDIPFSHVHVHPKILDGFGQTMSKSKGNGVDPLELVDKYGADAVRFTIASLAGETQDVRLPVGYECPHCGTVIPQTLEHQKAIPGGGAKPRVTCTKCKKSSQYTSPWFEPDAGEKVARIVAERFEYGRNFCNKFWNASRFAMLNLTDYTPGPVTADQLQLEDRWILSRLSTVANEMTEYLGRYQFDAATRAIREFTWNEFCDWYLEMIKPRLRTRRETSDERQEPEGGEAAGSHLSSLVSPLERQTAQRVLLYVLDSLVRLLQPFTPFICQELWSRLEEIAPTRCREPVSGTALAAGSSVGSRTPGTDASDPQPSTLNPQPVEPAAIVAAWPVLPRSWQDASLEKRFARLQETIVAVRNVRSIYNIPPTTQLQLLIRASSEVAGEMSNVAAQFDNLAKAVLTAAGADVVRPSASAGFSLGDADGYIPLKGIIDPVAELSRQQKEADKIRKHIAGHEGKLANEAFVAKAPADVVAGIRETLAGLKNQLGSVEEIIRDLGG